MKADYQYYFLSCMMCVHAHVQCRLSEESISTLDIIYPCTKKTKSQFIVLSEIFAHIHVCMCTGEVPCGCSEHVGRTIINDVYSCDVETMFKLIFTDSDFMRNFYKSENATSELWSIYGLHVL